MTEIPDHIRVLKNGAWYDTQRKHIVAGGTLKPEVARAMSNKRHEAAREQAALGLRRAMESQGMRVASPEGAWGSVIEAQSLLAIDIDAAHASTQAAKLVGQASGMLATRQDPSQSAPQVNILIDLSTTGDLAEYGYQDIVAGDGERVASEASAPVDAEFSVVDDGDS